MSESPGGQLEADGDLHPGIHNGSHAPRRFEPPHSHGLEGRIVQGGVAGGAFDADGPDPAVGTDLGRDQHFALVAPLPRRTRVDGGPVLAVAGHGLRVALLAAGARLPLPPGRFGR